MYLFAFIVQLYEFLIPIMLDVMVAVVWSNHLFFDRAP